MTNRRSETASRLWYARFYGRSQALIYALLHPAGTAEAEIATLRNTLDQLRVQAREDARRVSR